MSVTAAAGNAEGDRPAGCYQRHRPEHTLVYRLVEEYYPAFTAYLAEQGGELPAYVRRQFEDYLKCGRLEQGLLRVRCASCHVEHRVALSCKRLGFGPSCGARRMAERAALLVDEVLPEQPMRQWVLSFPYPLRFLLASRPEIMGPVLGIEASCAGGEVSLARTRAPSSALPARAWRSVSRCGPHH